LREGNKLSECRGGRPRRKVSWELTDTRRATSNKEFFGKYVVKVNGGGGAEAARKVEIIEGGRKNWNVQKNSV